MFVFFFFLLLWTLSPVTLDWCWDTGHSGSGKGLFLDAYHFFTSIYFSFPVLIMCMIEYLLCFGSTKEKTDWRPMCYSYAFFFYVWEEFFRLFFVTGVKGAGSIFYFFIFFTENTVFQSNRWPFYSQLSETFYHQWSRKNVWWIL